ncbi:nucleoside transmembrane transporter [Aureococcus anophagefferens]|nr:nucleoside transmembrane transporter [Aureococcus anophagefferens]
MLASQSKFAAGHDWARAKRQPSSPRVGVATPLRSHGLPSKALPLACTFVIGCASLFSWNAVITISSYWKTRFCGSLFETSFESVFAVTYQLTSLASNVYALRASQELSVRSRIVPTQWALVGVFAFAFLCAAVFGLAAALQGGFNAANMAGQAVGGVIPALIVVATVLSEGAAKPAADDGGDDGGCVAPRVDGGAVGYFVAAAGLFVVSIFAFRILKRQEVFLASSLATKDEPDDEAGLQASLMGVDAEPSIQAPAAKAAPGDLGALGALAREIRVPAAAVFLVFACTLAPFPALTALARAEGHADDDGGDGDLFRALFVPLLFLEFNVFDFVGRASAGVVKSPGARALLFAAVARFAFVPLIALGTLSGGAGGAPGLRSSAAPFAVMAPFALSNGLVATLAMGEAPQLSRRTSASSRATSCASSSRSASRWAPRSRASLLRRAV